jgi:hypothetical protein
VENYFSKLKFKNNSLKSILNLIFLRLIFAHKSFEYESLQQQELPENTGQSP